MPPHVDRTLDHVYHLTPFLIHCFSKVFCFCKSQVQRDDFSICISYWYAWWFSVLLMITWEKLFIQKIIQNLDHLRAEEEVFASILEVLMRQSPHELKTCPCFARSLSLTRASFAWNPIFKPKPWKKNGGSVWFLHKTRWSFVVQPRFDLEPERPYCAWLDPVLCFMFHLVLFPKPEIWGSDEGCKMSKMKVAWNLVQMKTTFTL